MIAKTTHKDDFLIQLARGLGGKNIANEDEAIAFCLNNTDENIRAQGFARLHAKYYEINREFLDDRCPEATATARDIIADRTFDRIQKYAAVSEVRCVKGSLGGFVSLVCAWEVRRSYEKESRRQNLLKSNLQNLWCIQREESEAYRGDAITDKDVEEIIAAIRRSLGPDIYPKTARILDAISTIFVNTNGMQVHGRPRNPSLTAIKDHLERNGYPISEEEISSCLKVLRRRVKAVLEENGWEIESYVSKYA